LLKSAAEPGVFAGRSYLLNIGAKTLSASVRSLRHAVNINALEPVQADQLKINDIGVVEIEMDRAVAFDAYRDNRDTGGFILIDKQSFETLGAGLIEQALKHDRNLHWQNLEVNKLARQSLNGHRSAVVWLTGLSGAGKTTIANLLEKRLHDHGVRSYLLDGDNLRHGLNRDLGFTPQDRVENIRRVAEVAKLMVDAGVLVIASFISPFRADRDLARALMANGEFIEVHVHAPLEVAESRDPKGLYKKARAGALSNFTGIDSPYEAPQSPEFVIATESVTAIDAAQQLFDGLKKLGFY
jgi:bifunctional enzyme CysN/CysC